MDAFLAEGVGCPVDSWDPVPDLDLSACPPEQQQTALAAGPEALSEPISTAYLDSNEETMWSVGRRDIAETDDALAWRTVPAPD